MKGMLILSSKRKSSGKGYSWNLLKSQVGTIGRFMVLSETGVTRDSAFVSFRDGVDIWTSKMMSAWQMKSEGGLMIEGYNDIKTDDVPLKPTSWKKLKIRGWLGKKEWLFLWFPSF